MEQKIVIDVDGEVVKRLDAAAAALGRTRSEIIHAAVLRYLVCLDAYAAEVRTGMDAADAGLTLSHTQVGVILKNAGVALE